MIKTIPLLLLLLTTALPPPDAAAAPNPDPTRSLRLQEIRVDPGGEVEKTVLRLIPLEVGDEVDPQVLIDTRRHLEGTDVFSCVDLYTARGDRPGEVILHVEAELRRGFRLETGLGRKLMQGWYLNIIGARYASPFHRGGYIRIGSHAAYRHNGIYIDAEYPRFLGDDIDLLFVMDHEVEQWPIAEPDVFWHQDVIRNRWHAGLRHWSRDGARATLWAGVSKADPDEEMSSDADDLEEPVGRLVPVPDGIETYLDLRLDLTWDRQDPIRSWRRGWWSGLRLKAHSRIDGPSFFGAEFDAHVAFPVGTHSALAMRLRSAYASSKTPYHMRPVLGGLSNLRGFEMGSLSGPTGARGIIQGSLEWREPVLGRDDPTPRVNTTLFLDVGDHWRDGSRPVGVSASIGYGMLIRIPWIQTLNAEVAFPLTDDLTDDPVVLNMSIGRSF